MPWHAFEAALKSGLAGRDGQDGVGVGDAERARTSRLFRFRRGAAAAETPDVERPEGEDDPALLEPVLEALRTVRDPEIPVNLVELGLIYELVVKKGGIVFVEMTLTTPACPVAQSMPGEVETRRRRCPGSTRCGSSSSGRRPGTATE